MRKSLYFRTFVALIAILFLLPTLAACGGNDLPPSETKDNGKTPEKPVVTNITLSAEDIKNYTIIMPKSCSADVCEAALDLFANMKDEGFELKSCVYDGGAEEQNIAEDAPEIIIGQTNRPQSTQTAIGLRKDDFTIAVHNSRIVIVGGSPSATAAAVSYFFESYVLGVASISILKAQTVTGEYDLTGMIDIAVNGTPICEYNISVPLQTTVAFDYAVSLLSDVIVEKTAYQLPIKRDTAAHGKTIRIEFCDGLGECEYIYDLQDDAWTIQVTERTLFCAIRNLVAQITATTSGTFDFADGDMGAFMMDSEVAPLPENLKGTLPVALCDQKNASAVVVDLSAPDPTANSAILWTWQPAGKGFSGASTNTFGYRIDEFKLRYSKILETYLVCVTSSAGFIGLAEYPSGEKIWEVDASGYGPHSIDYLPTGNVAVALSGNTAAGKQEVRLYACDENGVPTDEYVKDTLDSAHGIVWDNDWGILWALGATELIAYEIGGTPQNPTLTRIPKLGCTIKTCGHDLSVSAIDNGTFYLSSNAVYMFDKYTNTLHTDYDGKSLISTGAVKSIAVHTDGSILRAVAAGVYAPHDTDTLDVFRKNAAGEWVQTSYKFANRAFYKARPFILC